MCQLKSCWDKGKLILESLRHCLPPNNQTLFLLKQSGSRKTKQTSSLLTFPDWASFHFHEPPWAVQKSQQEMRYWCWAEGAHAGPGTGTGSAWQPGHSAAVLAAAGAGWPWEMESQMDEEESLWPPGACNGILQLLLLSSAKINNSQHPKLGTHSKKNRKIKCTERPKEWPELSLWIDKVIIQISSRD